MTRMLLITLLNISLPFLLRLGYLAYIHWHAKKQGIEKSSWHFPWIRIITIGLVLTLIFITVERVFFFSEDASFEHIIPKVDR